MDNVNDFLTFKFRGLGKCILFTLGFICALELNALPYINDIFFKFKRIISLKYGNLERPSLVHSFLREEIDTNYEG